MNKTIPDHAADGRRIPLSRTARTMVKHMTSAWQAPMFNLSIEVDLTDAIAARARDTTITDVMLAACAATLADHPRINAHYMAGEVVVFDAVHLGVAVATERGLTVPVLHNAETRSLPDLSARRRALIEKTRAGGLGMADVSGGTFTVSNLGMFGINRFTAIINPPQVAILAVGATNRRHVWRDETPAWRDIAELTLTCDHRAADGAQGAAFLADLKQRLESPT